MTTYLYRSTHPEVLANGLAITPGDRVDSGELQAADQYLLDEGRLVDIAQFEGDAPAKTTRATAQREEKS